MIQPSRAVRAIGLVVPGFGQAAQGRIVDALLMVVGTMAPLLFASLLLVQAVNERRFYERSGPPLALTDPQVADGVLALPTLPPQVPVLVGLALLVHLTGALAALRATHSS